MYMAVIIKAVLKQFISKVDFELTFILHNTLIQCKIGESKTVYKLTAVNHGRGL